jgi:transcription termination factor Rho
MSEHVHYISDDSFEQEVLQAGVPVLVDYWADWCGPCKMISPILDEVAKEYAGKLKVCKLNIDENQATPPKFGIRGIPTLMIFKNGNVEATKVGALSKSQLTAFVDSNIEIAAGHGIDNANRMRKQELIFAILKNAGQARREHLRRWRAGSAARRLRLPALARTSYLASTDDIYVSPSQIRRFNLHTGDSIEGEIRTPKDGERYFALVKVDKVNGEPPEAARTRSCSRTSRRCIRTSRSSSSATSRPRRTSPAASSTSSRRSARASAASSWRRPKAGKTVMLQHIAHAITANHPDVVLIVLLIDERPEEVTEMSRSVRGEVVASTFDEPASRHVQVAEMVIEKAKRLVEHKKDVVILLDSITRLARAYNTVQPASGKVLTGGVDANALQKPKRFFGAARNIEEGGSLTIIATALIDTGSRMDDVIYEEFKGTGNMEIHLDRRWPRSASTPRSTSTAPAPAARSC